MLISRIVCLPPFTFPFFFLNAYLNRKIKPDAVTPILLSKLHFKIRCGYRKPEQKKWDENEIGRKPINSLKISKSSKSVLPFFVHPLSLLGRQHVSIRLKDLLRCSFSTFSKTHPSRPRCPPLLNPDAAGGWGLSLPGEEASWQRHDPHLVAASTGIDPPAVGKGGWAAGLILAFRMEWQPSL